MQGVGYLVYVVLRPVFYCAFIAVGGNVSVEGFKQILKNEYILAG